MNMNTKLYTHARFAGNGAIWWQSNKMSPRNSQGAGVAFGYGIAESGDAGDGFGDGGGDGAGNGKSQPFA